MQFKNDLHKQNYKRFMLEDDAYCDDRERKALFYILSGHDDLVKSIDRLYDFNHHMIKKRGANCLSSSGNKLLKLAFHLYNHSNKLSGNSIVETFSSLDSAHRMVAIEAIKIRFGING
jgi:hypothetical protein